ncbi:replication-associated protein [Sewage-associated circular DNA virus-8]|uniref:Replication-associated protein n=1 Tax=Sewage-associated circular DNA virus-8 TaxID=1519397 RepID=A0A075IY19_9VIRU|nr:replication-associated protein [Sewage-associated circular DNA virus-8]
MSQDPLWKMQGRYWMLTAPAASFTPYLPPTVLYIRGQLETAASGFSHWQLLVITGKVRGSKLKTIFGDDVHIELTRSAAADDYVWKDDTYVDGTRFELGRRPKQLSKTTDWDDIWKSAVDGNLEDIESHVRVRYYNSLSRIRQDHLRPIPLERSCSVYWGRTGTGKSRRAWEEASMDAYPKNPRTKFWDGYRGHEHVVIDEFRGGIDIAYMLQWLDRYPVIVEVKGSSTVLRATRIWITSNIDPRDWYPLADQETKDALLRRLNITHFL